VIGSLTYIHAYLTLKASLLNSNRKQSVWSEWISRWNDSWRILRNASRRACCLHGLRLLSLWISLLIVAESLKEVSNTQTGKSNFILGSGWKILGMRIRKAPRKSTAIPAHRFNCGGYLTYWLE
jgi:hypothetical protein